MQLSKFSGVEKAAVLLLCLGEDATAKIFQELSDAEIRAISRCMMNIDHVPAQIAKEVIGEYKNLQKEYAGLFVSGNEFVKKAISAGADSKRAESLMEQVSSSFESRPLETIAMMQPRMVASLLQSEHPQTVALILSTQKPEHTAKIVNDLPSELRSEVMYRIARIDKVSPEVIAQIEDALQHEIGVVVSKEQQQVGGIDKVVEILGRLENGADRQILERIQETDPDMAEDIRKKMFTFDDLVALDSRALQTILREVNNDQLTLALKTATDGVKEKILASISSRAAEMIQEDIEALGPVRLTEVERMQQEIVTVALRLEEEGKILIPGRGGGDVLV
ncbi:MAG TPA: flagellar motor switch protein FliG [Desulfuromonadales bacterium]|nr:flagellar motor switch protein FliG [Desulfuromonadales bacterium]